MPNVIGIDLGTSFSSVAIFKNGQVVCIQNDYGNSITPSCVALTDTEFVVGERARITASPPHNIIFGVHRLIGANCNDPEIQTYMKYWPFHVAAGNEECPKILAEFKGATREFYPEEILFMILTKMKKIAENFLGESVKDAVITTPVYFNTSQRQAIKDASKIAGLNVLRIIPAPNATALAYGFDKSIDNEKKVLVFDLGGGTCDVSILTIDNEIYEVKSVAGDIHLGGEDFNMKLVNHFVAEFKRKHTNIKFIASNPAAIYRLWIACENAKCVLSTSTVANIEINSFVEGIDFYTSITRAEFERICANLFRKTMDPVQKALQDAKLENNQIDEIIITGGSSRIPKIQEMLSDFFDGKLLNKSLNPEEAAACGAAIQGAVLSRDASGAMQDFVLIDVAPFSLGVKGVGGVMTPVIKRNTAIPTGTPFYFTTQFHNQTEILVEVYEGESAMTKDNKFLGKLVLDGIPPAPQGYPKIEVVFDVDYDNILIVSALDKSTEETKKSLNLTHERTRLSENEIQRLINFYNENTMDVQPHGYAVEFDN